MREITYREGNHGAWIDDGKQYVSNGYMLIENSGTPLDLPTLPDDAKLMHVQSIIKARTEKEYPDTLACPTIVELKSGIKEQKALAKCKYDRIKDVRYRFGGWSCCQCRVFANCSTSNRQHYSSRGKSYCGA